jgi:DNA polymerase-4
MSLAEIAEGLVRVVRADHPDQQTITLLAISVAHLVRNPLLQLELPLGLSDEARRTGSRQGRARLTADHAIDRIRTRFGREAIGYGEVALDKREGVPDAFRSLAEKDL